MLAELNDTETAKAVAGALPLTSTAERWGDEVYFSTPLVLPQERPTAHAAPGAVAYWLPGKAICIFFGQTPASPVDVIGSLRGNPRDFAAVKEGDAVVMRAAGEAAKTEP